MKNQLCRTGALQLLAHPSQHLYSGNCSNHTTVTAVVHFGSIKKTTSPKQQTGVIFRAVSEPLLLGLLISCITV